MKDNIEVCIKFIDFTCQYGMIKSLKTMFLGSFVILLVYLIRMLNRGKNANVNFYGTLLLLPMAFTGMTKLFYEHIVMFRATAYIYMIACSSLRWIYFIGLCVLLIYVIYKNVALKKWVEGLSPLADLNLKEKAISVVLSSNSNKLVAKYLDGVKVCTTNKEISPFSGGIIKPYIVVPEKVFATCNDEEQLMMLCHEYMHIKSGHIVWIILFKLLWIYWWINPIMYFLNKHLCEDMEMACDEKCIWYAKAEPYVYGTVLLTVAKNMQQKSIRGVASLVAGNDFGKIKTRISYLEKVSERKSFFKKQRTMGIAFMIIIVGIVTVIYMNSYPRFTVDRKLCLFDETFTLRIDDEELSTAVSIKEGKVVINHERFKALLDKYDISDEYVYIPFETIFKLPGVGGGGNAAMVSTSDYDDVFYLAADNGINRVMIFLLKYVI